MPRKLVRRQSLHELPDLPPLRQRLFSNRGVESADELDYSLKKLHSPNLLKDIDSAVGILMQTIAANERILIVGDFDADGATSCALLVSGLRALGASHVDYLVPDRFRFGYGLTSEIVEVAREKSPDLIVTVDNGISSLDGVATARALGYKVIITDHHLPGRELPQANAIVNPNQPGCEFPSKSLAGVGVAFYLLTALRSRMRDEGVEVDANLADWLDLVALGTIADVVPMDHNNRILVAEGIRRIRGGRARPGLYALLQISGLESQRVNSRDLAFSVGPRLNAAGRLENISLGIECLLANSDEGLQLAQTLQSLNEERKILEREMKRGAEQQALNLSAIRIDDQVGITLFNRDWHQGVVGIVASRIKERFHRPTIVFAPGENDELKGSARSIQGLHIRDALDSIATQNEGLISKFGGHAMAAGLTIDRSNLERFRDLFDQEARRWLTDEDLEQVVVTDGELDEISLTIAWDVSEMAPWGQAFPEPVFDGEFEVLDQRIVGERHLKLLVRPISGQEAYDAIFFNRDRLLERRHTCLAYRLDINRYRGSESVQLIVEAADIVKA